MGYKSSLLNAFIISISSVVRGYHMYQDVWSARVGEQLTCDQDPGNRYDIFAVTLSL